MLNIHLCSWHPAWEVFSLSTSRAHPFAQTFLGTQRHTADGDSIKLSKSCYRLLCSKMLICIKSQMACELWSFIRKWLEKATVYPNSYLCWMKCQVEQRMGHSYPECLQWYHIQGGLTTGTEQSLVCSLTWVPLGTRMVAGCQSVNNIIPRWEMNNRETVFLFLFSSGRLMDKLIYKSLPVSDQHPVSHMYSIIEPS